MPTAPTLIPRLNYYQCRACNHLTVTVDVDEGVTPFMIGCTQEGCEGSAFSSMYPAKAKPDHIPEPTHEWYRPDAAEQKRMRKDRYALAHVQQGGLLMRPRTDRAPITHAAS